MAAHYATFGLAPATRAGAVLSNGAYEAHRDFWDFIVDGRPLLLRLADLDAVSPLAADLGPSLFTAHVRRLLLEEDAPLADGRYVLYGCPECEGLECGAVTAVIERDGPDVVWRDFAWQTGRTADLRRDGYPGIGPFRFHGARYRAALENLLSEAGPERGAAASRRVLLVGRRVALPARLAAALRGIGIGAEITRDAAGASPDELRSYGAVAFGSAVGEAERTAVRAAFAAAGSSAVFVDLPVPVVPLLVARVEQALDRCPQDQRRLLRLAAARGEVTVETAVPCRIGITAYRVDRLSRTRTAELFAGQVEAGTHRLAVDARATRGTAYVVARTSGSVLVAPVAGE
ncbi:oxidoreductase [Streptomyces chrestomyceticus JCM 4735]|uniref:Oxidoreductase n=1 Tax=Streptomyces chrestomyceticus JCM 4735 TaxID=1306181 RepID=A0A7U9KSY9_9ACTN|nr:oxidoreductase [Streptomyces chrestomyceticus]GCD33471.1 oxidoreductase [Streptomyces chrestomyceticus JCM 4735]